MAKLILFQFILLAPFIIGAASSKKFECGLSNYDPTKSEEVDKNGNLKIINGLPVVNGSDLPWMAAIHMNTTFWPFIDHTFLCTATILSEKWILTAGHCAWLAYAETGLFNETGPFPPMNYTKLVVHVGDTNFSSPNAILVRSRRIIPHFNYTFPGIIIQTGPLHDDIALIELENELVFGPNVRPICLPDSEAPLNAVEKNGDDLIIAGWGKLDRNDDPGTDYDNWSPQILHVGQEKELNISACKQIEKWTWPQFICLNESSLDGKETYPFNGDSGGPLLYRDPTKSPAKWTQYGVACALSYHMKPPAVYIKIAHYCAWIRQNIDEAEISGCGGPKEVEPKLDATIQGDAQIIVPLLKWIQDKMVTIKQSLRAIGPIFWKF